MKIRPDCANFVIYLKLDAIATSWTLVSWVRNCLKKVNPRKTLLYFTLWFTKSKLICFS